jgi:hypothetical protein
MDIEQELRVNIGLNTTNFIERQPAVPYHPLFEPFPCYPGIINTREYHTSTIKAWPFRRSNK